MPMREYFPPPKDPGEDWRELLFFETLEPGDEFWATARGFWVPVGEPSYFGLQVREIIADAVSDGCYPTKYRRRLDFSDLEDEEEDEETLVGAELESWDDFYSGR